VSRLKEHIYRASGMRTSDEVPPVLSDHLRRLADRAIENARDALRHTVMARDFPFPAQTEDPVLVVASHMKRYIQERSGLRTSDDVLGPLSHAVARLAETACDNARAAGRKTVLARDVPPT
jgi:histone H3/H4